LKSFRASLKTNPKLHPASPERLWQPIAATLADAGEAAALFGRLPKAPLEVAAFRLHCEEHVSRLLRAGHADGSRPGRLRVNLYNATSAISTR